MLIIIAFAAFIVLLAILNKSFYEKSDGVILLLILATICSAVVVSVGGINLVADLSTAKSNEIKLEKLHSQAIIFIEAKEILQYNRDFNMETFNELIYDKVKQYNNHLDFCQNENNSVLIGDFVNYDFCEKYKPIIIKNNRDFYLTS